MQKSKCPKSLAICLIPITLCIGCSIGTETHVSRDSPDGQYSAKLSQTNFGATVDSEVQVSLEGRYYGSPNSIESKRVFFGYGGWPNSIHWIDDNNLVIESCDAKEVRVETLTVKPLSKDGNLDQAKIYVHLVSAPDSKIFGKVFCQN